MGITSHDLRGAAVTRLALAGCTEPDIAVLAGHLDRDLRMIVDSHDLDRDPALADNAI